jgi:transcriptional regulator with XRE-family HTH domain
VDMVLKLRELRRVRGLTQAQAADRAGISSKTLSSFESGARIRSMKLTQLLRLLEVCRIEPDAFFRQSLDELTATRVSIGNRDEAPHPPFPAVSMSDARRQSNGLG